MRHHRKLLRRLRALFPVTDRRGVIVERTPSGWRVVAGRVMAGRVMVGTMIGTRRGPVRMIDGGAVIAWNRRRCDALQEALRRRAREVRA